MARFDLYRRPRGAKGYLLDVQSQFLDHLRTRVVVPLLPPEEVPAPLRDLHPRFTVEGAPVLLATQLLGAIALRELGPPIGNLGPEQDAICRALDLLFTGF